jgi:hypothetical protein
MTFFEVCPYCGEEIQLDCDFGFVMHECECGEMIKPCTLCMDMHTAYGEVFGGLDSPNCNKCPFDTILNRLIIGDTE